MKTIESSEVNPYEALAPIYDRVMSHVNYQGWTQFVIRILTDHGVALPDDQQSPLILECGCGTGSVAIRLALNGFEVEAFDQSPAMIEIASAKLPKLSRPPSFRVGDFLNLDQVDRYDAAICLYDSINYLMTPEEITDFLRRIKRSLKPGGLFLFDVCTEFNSKINFTGSEIEETGSDFSYRRDMIYNRRAHTQENLFTIQFDNMKDKEFIERHIQRIYTLSKIRSLIRKSKLKIVTETDDIERIPPHSKSLRVHFLCRG